jgi:DNA repair exonuclease SbcCD nuclease subunit
MTYTILHLADLHLDVQFRDLSRAPKVANARREALRSALKRALALARTQQVDAVTIGGDLYEAEHISADTILDPKSCTTC